MDPAASQRIASLVERIRQFCGANADDRVILKYAKFFREGYDPYGVPFDVLEAEGKRIVREHRSSLGCAGFLDLADRLMDSGKYEEACFAIHFVQAFDRDLTGEAFRMIERWFDGKVLNWAVSDGICGGILSGLLSREVVSPADFEGWRSSTNKWKRRAVPVAMLALLKRDHDAGRLLEMIRPMMLDAERVVHQGLGWFLREAWRKHPAEVEAFLFEWKDSAPRLIFQYATEKMTAADRARFRRAKPVK